MFLSDIKIKSVLTTPDIYFSGWSNYILMALFVGAIGSSKRSGKYNYEIHKYQKKRIANNDRFHYAKQPGS